MINRFLEFGKFNIDEFETHLDKWLFILRNLANLSDPPPESLQETAFSELFEVAAIANFSRLEQDSYQNSLKYYRDMNNVVDTARQEGVKKGIAEGMEKGMEKGIEEGRLAERSLILNRQRSLVLRLLSRTIGEIPEHLITQINQLPIEKLEVLNEVLLDFNELNDLVDWLETHSGS